MVRLPVPTVKMRARQGRRCLETSRAGAKRDRIDRHGHSKSRVVARRASRAWPLLHRDIKRGLSHAGGPRGRRWRRDDAAV